VKTVIWRWCAAFACAVLALSAHGADLAKVLQVLDGDTCQLENDRRVRYLGMDAPEKNDPHGEEATQANNKLVGGKQVRLEPGKPQKDRDGRLLAYVFVGETLVNEELLRLGWAQVRRPVARQYKERFFQAQEEARKAGRGIWVKAREWNLRVAEVHAKPEGGARNLNDEYVVIENCADDPVNLTGWSVLDETHHRYLVPNFVLPAKGKVTLRTGLGKNTGGELFWGNRTSIWNDNGDTILLKDDKGNLILCHVY